MAHERLGVFVFRILPSALHPEWLHYGCLYGKHHVERSAGRPSRRSDLDLKFQISNLPRFSILRSQLRFWPFEFCLWTLACGLYSRVMNSLRFGRISYAAK